MSGMSQPGQFVSSILFSVIAPLLSLLLQLAFSSNPVSTNTYLFVASVYAVTVYASSRSPLLFITCLLLGLFFGMAYAWNAAGNRPAPLGGREALAFIGVISIINVGDRVKRHLIQGEPFWQFQW